MSGQGQVFPAGVGRPIMFSGLAALILGGLAGVSRMLQYQGVEVGALEALSSIFYAHWFLMVFGFLLALISMEILALLSFEWSGRVADPLYRGAYLALFWSSIALLLAGSLDGALAIASISLAVLAIYASRVFLRPSRLGFKPTHYGYLLTASPLVGSSIAVVWLAAKHLTGSYIYDIAVASLAFPVASIIAVESRDIPLLLGGSPAGPSRGRLVAAGYSLALGGILLASTRAWQAGAVGGLLIAAGGLLSAAGSGLLKSLLQGARGGLVPRYMATYSAFHLATAFSWLALGGVLASLYRLGLLEAPGLRDISIHAISLGFIFNTIFGVDAVLMYSHMGISLRRAPKPSYIPYVLLNTSLILRAVYDATGYTGITVISAPLTGISIVLFFALHNIRIAMLRAMLRDSSPSRAEPGSVLGRGHLDRDLSGHNRPG